MRDPTATPKALYQREWRQRNPERHRFERWITDARTRAKTVLAKRHLGEYEEILADELAKLPPRLPPGERGPVPTRLTGPDAHV